MQTRFDYTRFPVLETDRLRLREIVPADVAAIQQMFGHPGVFEFLVDFEQPMQTEAEALEIVDWCAAQFAHHRGLRWAITRREQPETLIGTCGFNYWDQQNRRAEIGYDLDHAYWRQGIMSEALRRMLNFGFAEMALHRIEADVTVGNVASANLLRKLGFQHEGTWRQRVYTRGQYYDLWQFGLLTTEYHGPR